MKKLILFALVFCQIACTHLNYTCDEHCALNGMACAGLNTAQTSQVYGNQYGIYSAPVQYNQYICTSQISDPERYKASLESAKKHADEVSEKRKNEWLLTILGAALISIPITKHNSKSN